MGRDTNCPRTTAPSGGCAVDAGLLDNPITQFFGERPEFYQPYGYPGHEGLDLSATEDSPLRSLVDGTAEVRASPGYGNYVIVETCDHLKFYFAHLNEIIVHSGAPVHASQLLGFTGNTGRSTGPHVHVGVRVSDWQSYDPYKGFVDPLPVLLALTQEGQMARSKLAFQTQKPEYDGWLKRAVADTNVTTVEILDPDRGEAQPFGQKVNYYGRLTFPNNADATMVDKGAAGAEEWVGAVRPRIQRCPWVRTWQLPNEPFVGSLEQAQRYVAFHLKAALLMRSYGVRLASAPLGTGNPPDMGLWKTLGAIFGPAGITEEQAISRGYIALAAVHEYGMRDMYDLTGDSHLLRYRTAWRNIASQGYRVPCTVVSETGIDFAGQPEDGWRRHTSGPADYMRQLASYDARLMQDSQLLWAAPFAWKTTKEWSCFESTEDFTLNHYVPYLRQHNVNAEELMGDYLQLYVIPRNLDSAFSKYADTQTKQTGMQWEQMSGEVDYGIERCQVWYTRQNDMQRIVHAVRGHWDEVHHFDRPNGSASLP